MPQQCAHLGVGRPTSPATEHRWCKIVCADPFSSEYCQPTRAKVVVISASNPSRSTLLLVLLYRTSVLPLNRVGPIVTATASRIRALVNLLRGNFSLRLPSSSLALPPPSYVLQSSHYESLLIRSSLSTARYNAKCAKETRPQLESGVPPPTVRHFAGLPRSATGWHHKAG